MFIQEWWELREPLRSSRFGRLGKSSLFNSSVTKDDRGCQSLGIQSHRWWAVSRKCSCGWGGEPVNDVWPQNRKGGRKEAFWPLSPPILLFPTCASHRQEGKGPRMTDLVRVSSVTYAIKKRRVQIWGDKWRTSRIKPFISHTTFIFLNSVVCSFGFVFLAPVPLCVFFLRLWLFCVCSYLVEWIEKHFSLLLKIILVIKH